LGLNSSASNFNPKKSIAMGIKRRVKPKLQIENCMRYIKKY
jgi:hypothetical protein